MTRDIGDEDSNQWAIDPWERDAEKEPTWPRLRVENCRIEMSKPPAALRLTIDGQAYTDLYTVNEDGEPVPCFDVLVWAEWRRLHRNAIQTGLTQIGDRVVSTVFTGIDHSFERMSDLSVPPILWETLVFGDPAAPLGAHRERYTNLAEAVAGHTRAVDRVLALAAMEHEHAERLRKKESL